MTTEADPAPSRQQTPTSARLPQAPPDKTMRHVAALHELAAPSTADRIAGQLGVAKAGRFLSTLAACGYYGFFSRSGGRYTLTERGESLLASDADKATQAKREGVMSSGFAPVISLLATREAKEEIVSARLQDDLGVPEKSAKEISRVLIAAATDAGLLRNGRFDAATIEDTVAAVGVVTIERVTPEGSDAQSKSKPKSKSKPRVTPARGSASSSATKDQVADRLDVPFAQAPGLQVHLHIDGSAMTAQELAELVEALKQTTTSPAVSSGQTSLA